MSFISTGLTRTRKFHLFLIVLSAFISTNASAQFVQSNRVEFPITRSAEGFEVIPAFDDGLFLYRRFIANTNDQLQIVKIDTSFAIQWQGYVDIDRKLALMGSKSQHQKLYLLFRHREITKKDFELIVMDNSNGEYIRHRIRNFISFVPNEFQVTQTGAVIGGYFNNVPVVIFYSFTTGYTKVLPGLLNEAGELTQIKTDPGGTFDVLIVAKSISGQKTVWVRKYDADGDLLVQIPLEPEGNRHLIFARSVTSNNEAQLIAGTYGNRKSEYSKGIFVGRIDPDGHQELKYYNYGDLSNFFKYMKAKRETRVKERIERRRIRGKKVRFNYRFIVHEIIPFNDQFVLLGEAFYPKYVTVDRFSTGGFFNPYNGSFRGYSRDGRIFDGYRYTHAVVLGFNSEGKLLWDNSFEINDIKTFNLEQFVNIQPADDRIALFYLYENEIRSKIIQGSDVLEGKTFSPLRMSFPGDIAKKERSSGSKLEYWYGPYFYAFGTQEISNSESGTRRVFYLNKISYTGHLSR